MQTVIILVEADVRLAPSLTSYLPNMYMDETGVRVVIHKADSIHDHFDRVFHDATLRAHFSREAGASAWDAYCNIKEKFEIGFTKFDKQTQAKIIESRSKGLEGFINLRVSMPTELREVNLRTSRVLMKPAGAARSLGQVLFNQEFTIPDAVRTELSLSRSADNLVDRLAKLPGNPIYSRGHEHRDEEGYSQLKHDPIFQEYAENITHEFRIITGHDGMPCISMDRKREAVDEMAGYFIPQKAPDKFSTNDLQRMFPKVDEQLRIFLQRANLPLHSLDIFVTRDGQWGIFEFSTEFSGCEYRPAVIQEEARKYISKYIVKPYLECHNAETLHQA